MRGVRQGRVVVTPGLIARIEAQRANQGCEQCDEVGDPLARVDSFGKVWCSRHTYLTLRSRS